MYLFPLHCPVVRLLAPTRVLKLLLLDQQCPSFQIQCTNPSPPPPCPGCPLAVFLELSAAIYTIITSPLLKLFTPLFLEQCLGPRILMAALITPQASLAVTASYIFVGVPRLCLQLPSFFILPWGVSVTLPVSVLRP